jgi:polysaccharide deacetylase 2 family uncharacterized protein YibQ
MGLPVYRRSVFLDNVRDVRAITRQMEKAARAAAATGQAVAIGHPTPKPWPPCANGPSAKTARKPSSI